MTNLMRKSGTPVTVLRNRDNYINSFDRIFDEMFKTTFPEIFKISGIETIDGGYPKVNVMSYPESIVIEAEIAGMDKKDISVDVNIEHGEKYLTIRGSKSTDVSEKNEDEVVYLRRELKRSSFSRTFHVGNTLNLDNISAEFNNGLLTITIPKMEKETGVTKVEIK